MNILGRLLVANGKEQSSNGPADPAKLVIQLTNCRLIRNKKLIKDDLWIRDGRILDPIKLFYEEKRQADMQIDCGDLIISPGFIDLQLNGAFGRDFTHDHNIAECLNHVSTNLLKYGCTAFCPTIVSSLPDVYARVLPHVKSNVNHSNSTAQILGAHLEGPFISRQKLGAHDKSALRTLDSDIKTLETVYGMNVDDLSKHVAIVTLAPELDPEGLVIKSLTKNKITVSIGHSEANLAQGEAAIGYGARFITHLFNAMLPFHHRDPHLIGLLSDSSLTNNIFYGIIADNIHTHPSALNIAYKAHPNGLVLVTDAIAAMGLDEGKVHQVGEQLIEIVESYSNGRRLRSAYIQGSKTLCGSVATIDDCVRNLISATGCSLVDACRCASEHPAKLMNLYPSKGSLEFGADADLVLIDENVNVRASFVKGDLAWSASDWSPKFKFRQIP